MLVIPCVMKQTESAPDKEQGRSLDLATINMAVGREDDKIQGSWCPVAHAHFKFYFS